MIKVKDMLAKKGSEVHTIPHDKTVFDAVAKMTEANVGALVVTHRENDRDKVCGIISERDYLRHIVLEGRTSRSTPVHEIMTKKVIYTDLQCSADEVLQIMSDKRIRHLPILEGDDLMGIISIGDSVKTIIKDQKVQIRYLTEYIADSYPGPGNNNE